MYLVARISCLLVFVLPSISFRKRFSPRARRVENKVIVRGAMLHTLPICTSAADL